MTLILSMSKPCFHMGGGIAEGTPYFEHVRTDSKFVTLITSPQASCAPPCAPAAPQGAAEAWARGRVLMYRHVPQKCFHLQPGDKLPRLALTSQAGAGREQCHAEALFSEHADKQAVCKEEGRSQPGSLIWEWRQQLRELHSTKHNIRSEQGC